MKLNLFLILFLTLHLSHSRFLVDENTSTVEVKFSKESGFYDNEFELTLSSSDNSKIYYTTDGSDPSNSQTSKEYSSPIKVKDRTQEPNIYAAYDENEYSPTSICRGAGYKKPPFNVEKGMIVRAIAKSSNGNSKIFQHTYFVTTGDLSMFRDYTIVSLVTNPENLYDPEKGIYVTGNQYINWLKNGGSVNIDSLYDNRVCNYFMKGSEWEKEAYIEIFEKGTLTIQENVGIRIKGSSTRDDPQKNFNVYTKKKYGNKFIKSDTLFPDNKDIQGNFINSYDSFALRGISDELRSRDQFATRFIKDRTLQSTTKMKNSYLFLNGEFWGLYVITEKYSSKFFADHYNLKKDDIVYMKEEKPKGDSDDEVSKLIDFIKQYSDKDLSDSTNYKEVTDVIDVDSLIEHYATGIFLATYDWPNNNYGLWRNSGNKIDGNLFSDGKWRVMTYDLDFTMGKTFDDFDEVEGYAYNMFEHVDREKKNIPTNIFCALLKNKEFKEKFVEVFKEYANKIMTSNIANSLVSEYTNSLTEMIAHSQTRWWGYLRGNKMETFAYAKNQYLSVTLPQIKTFFEKRAKYAIEDMEKYLSQY